MRSSLRDELDISSQQLLEQVGVRCLIAQRLSPLSSSSFLEQRIVSQLWWDLLRNTTHDYTHIRYPELWMIPPMSKSERHEILKKWCEEHSVNDKSAPDHKYFEQVVFAVIIQPLLLFSSKRAFLSFCFFHFSIDVIVIFSYCLLYYLWMILYFVKPSVFFLVFFFCADNPAPLPVFSLRWAYLLLVAWFLPLQLRHKDFEISAIREELELSSQELSEQVLDHFSWLL